MPALLRTLVKFVTAAGLLAGSSGLAGAFEFEAETGWNDQLFPSYIIATATVKVPEEALEEHEDEAVLGDPQGLLGVTVEATEDDQEITVTISCDAIMAESTFSGTLAEAGEIYTIYPKIKYRYDVLASNSQPCPITVTYSVELGDEDEEEESETLTLRSVNDCPFTIVEKGEEGEEDQAMDVSFMFAAYVNEQHPFVDKLLREALSTGVVDAFTGYQSGDKAEVYRQVYALWHALSKRDLRYSDITTSSAESDSVYSQHVRLLDESLNNGQANCVDGSVLLASLLRKIGIEPILVMVPRHCYLAFWLDAEGKELAALETTLLGTAGGKPVKIAGVSDVVDKDWMDENSWKTFTAALAMGTADLTKNDQHFQDSADPDYQLIPVIAARKIGILPISFRSRDKLQAAPGSE